MYYSLTFSYDKPNEPLRYRFDNVMYPASNASGINNKNTWMDWHLVPTERPSIAPPEVITKTVEIPGMGDLDLTESLTGYPAYKNRTGSITFMVMNDYENWHDIYQKMCSYLHGRKLYMSYEEDPGYFYRGRFTVEAYEAGDNNSEITINYELEPYKHDYNNGTFVGGYWDIFDFDTDNRLGFTYDISRVIDVNSDTYTTIAYNSDWGNFTEEPIIPTFIVSNLVLGGFITIHYVNSEMGIDFEKTIDTNGSYRIPEIIFTQIRNQGKIRFGFTPIQQNDKKSPVPIRYEEMYAATGDIFKLEIKGHGKLTIDYNAGRK